MAIVLYKLTLAGVYQSTNWNNVFHYETQSDDSPSADELISIWQTEWLNALKDFMNVSCNIASAYVLNLMDYGDYSSDTIGVNGLVGSGVTGLPPQWASCFTANTTGSVIRHGYKRFTGVDESMVASGQLATGFVSAADVICAKMIATLNGASAEYFPVAVRYNEATPPVPTLWTLLVDASFRRFNTQRSRIA